MRRTIVLLATLALTTACAHLLPSRSNAPCDPAKLAPSWLVAGSVYRDCEVDRRAIETEPKVTPAWKPTTFNHCNWSVVEFVVDTAGLPEPKSERLVSSNEPGLGVVHLKSVAAKRFLPAEKQGQRVRQVVRDPVIFIMDFKMKMTAARDTSCHP